MAAEPVWRATQRKVFTGWVNVRLQKRSLNVKELTSGFEDGIVLCNLVEICQNKSLPKKINTAPRFVVQKLENLGLALAAIKEDKITLTNIAAEDIQSGNEKLVLGLVWLLIQRYQIEDVAPAKAPPGVHPLLYRVNEMLSLDAATKGNSEFVKVDNWGSSWQNGLAFCGLIHACRPELIPGFAAMRGDTAEANLELAFSVAHAEFDLPRLLEPREVATGQVDDLSLMTYVAMLLKALQAPAPAAPAPPSISAADLYEISRGLRQLNGKLRTFFTTFGINSAAAASTALPDDVPPPSAASSTTAAAGNAKAAAAAAEAAAVDAKQQLQLVRDLLQTCSRDLEQCSVQAVAQDTGLRQQLSDAQKVQADCEQAIALLQPQLTQLVSDKQRLEGEVANYLSLLGAQQTAVGELSDERQQLREKIEQQTNDFAERLREKDELLRASAAEVQYLLERMGALESELKDQRARSAKVSAEIVQLTHKMALMLSAKPAAGAAAGPKGDVALVWTAIQDSKRLWAEYPEAMVQSVRLVQSRVRRVIKDFDGYEVASEMGHFWLAFASPLKAVMFGAALQEELLGVEQWPEALLNDAALREERYDGAAGGVGRAGDLLFRGLRVRIAIHYGRPEADDEGGHTSYLGADVKRGELIAEVVHGGQVLVSRSVWDLLDKQLLELPHIECRVLGEYDLAESVQTPHELLVQVLPRSLAARRFPAILTKSEQQMEAAGEQMKKMCEENERLQRRLQEMESMAQELKARAQELYEKLRANLRAGGDSQAFGEIDAMLKRQGSLNEELLNAQHQNAVQKEEIAYLQQQLQDLMELHRKHLDAERIVRVERQVALQSAEESARQLAEAKVSHAVEIADVRDVEMRPLADEVQQLRQRTAELRTENQHHETVIVDLRAQLQEAVAIQEQLVRERDQRYLDSLKSQAVVLRENLRERLLELERLLEADVATAAPPMSAGDALGLQRIISICQTILDAGMQEIPAHLEIPQAGVAPVGGAAGGGGGSLDSASAMARPIESHDPLKWHLPPLLEKLRHRIESEAGTIMQAQRVPDAQRQVRPLVAIGRLLQGFDAQRAVPPMPVVNPALIRQLAAAANADAAAAAGGSSSSSSSSAVMSGSASSHSLSSAAAAGASADRVEALKAATIQVSERLIGNYWELEKELQTITDGDGLWAIEIAKLAMLSEKLFAGMTALTDDALVRRPRGVQLERPLPADVRSHYLDLDGVRAAFAAARAQITADVRTLGNAASLEAIVPVARTFSMLLRLTDTWVKS